MTQRTLPRRSTRTTPSGAQGLNLRNRYALPALLSGSGVHRFELTRQRPRLVVPGYVYPDAPATTGRLTWDAWIAGGDPVRWIIANPGSPGGPGTFTDTNYQAVIAQAQARGVGILGYVDTSYAIPSVSTPVIDTFNSGASQDLTARAGWAPDSLFTVQPSIATNATPNATVAPAGSAASNYIDTGSNDNEMRAKLAGTSGTLVIFVRVSNVRTPVHCGYYLLWAPASGGWSLVRSDNGVSGPTLASGTVAGAIGDEISVRAVGDRIEAWRKPAAGTWTRLASVSETTYPVGTVIGVEVITAGPPGTGPTLDEVGGGVVGATPMSQIDAWKTWYGINDIFFDQTASGAEDLAYHRKLCDYVRSSAPSAAPYVLMNPGTTVDEGYASMADTLCVFEGPESSYTGVYTPSSWNANWPASKFLHLVYNVASNASMKTALTQAISQNAGYFYAVDTAVWFAASALDPAEYSELRASGGTLMDSGTCTITIVPIPPVIPRPRQSSVVGAYVPGMAYLGENPPVVTSASDTGLCTIVVAQAAAETLSDSGLCTIVVSQAAAQTINDAGTNSLVVVPTAIEGPAEIATQSIIVSQTGAETLADAGVVTFVVAPSGGLETVSDAGTVTIVVSQSSAPVGSDAGTCAFVVSPAAAETLSDAGTVTIVVSPTGSENASDAASVTIVVSQAGSETLLTTYILAAPGGGNWNAGATWVGGVVPTASDNVLMNNTSGNVTITASTACRSLDCLGYAGTLTHNASCMLTIGDGTVGLSNRALRLSAGMTYTLGSASTSAITFASTSATAQFITWAGKTVGPVTFDGAGAYWQFSSAFIGSAGSTLTLTRGTLDTNGFAVTALAFSSNVTNTRVLVLAGSVLTFTDTGYQTWRANGTGLTVIPGTSQIILTGAASRFAGGGKTYYDVALRGTGISDVDGGNTFHTLERSNAAAVTLTLTSGATTTITSSLVASGTAGNVVTINSSTPGSAATISKASGTVSLDYVSIQDSTATGGATFNAGPHATDVSGNTGWVFTLSDVGVVTFAIAPSGAETVSDSSSVAIVVSQTALAGAYIVAASGGGNWTTGATWVGGVAPTASDIARLDATSGNVTIDSGGAVCRSLDCTGYTGTLTHNASATLTIGDAGGGSLTMVAGMTYTKLAGSSCLIVFASTTTGNTITWGGKQIGSLTFNGVGGGWTLQDSMITFGTQSDVTLTAGSLDLNGQTVSIRTFTSTNSNTRSLILGAANITISSAFNGGWDLTTTTGLTFSGAASTITLNGAGPVTQLFRGGGLSYGTVNITGSGTIGITGNNTFVNFTRSNAAACGLTLPNGGTQTITGTLQISGTAGQLVSVTSVTAGTASSFSKASGSVAVDYVSLKDNTATGGATFNAGTHSTDVSGNSGWMFGLADAGTVSITITPSASEVVSNAALVKIGLDHYRAVVLASGPSEYYRLGEASGTALVDETGGAPGTKGATVVVAQPSLLVADADASSYFPGTTATASSAAQPPNRTALAASFTIEALINLDTSPPAQHQTLFSAHGTGEPIDSDTGSRMAIVARRNAAGNRLSYWDSTTSWIESTATLTPGAIQHVVVVVTASLVKFYVNGVAVGSGAMGTLPTLLTQQMLGGSRHSSLQRLKGFLDEFAIYDYELTAANVAAHYSSILARGGLGADAIVDAATQPIVVAPSGAETLRDAGTVVVVVTPTGAETMVAAAATTRFNVPIGTDRVFGVLEMPAGNLAAKQAIRAAGATHCVIAAPWSTLQPSGAGTALDSTALTALNLEFTQARAAGLRVMFELAIHYAPAWALSAIEGFTDQNAATFNASGAPSGQQVANWVWTAVGRTHVADFANKVATGLGSNLGLIDEIKTGGGYYGELHYPPPAGAGNSFYAYGSSMQTGTGLAADQVVCPWPGYVIYSGTPAKDQDILDWYLNGLATWAKAFVAIQRAAGFNADYHMALPGYGVRSNNVISDAGYKQAAALGEDPARMIAALARDEGIWPYSTWMNTADGFAGGTVDSDKAAWKKIYEEALKNRRTSKLWGENTGGENTAGLNEIFGGGTYGSALSGATYPGAPAITLGYRGLFWATYSSLVAGGGNASLADLSAGISSFPPVPQIIIDAGTCSITVSQTAAQTLNEPAATVTIVVSQTASESVTGGGGSDAGTVSFSVTPTASEALVEIAAGNRLEITRLTQRLVVPAYVYPDAPATTGRNTWDAWIAGRDPVKFIIANPGSPGGPGTFTDTNYAAVIAQAQAAGITILGYVDTSYTVVAAATAKGQIDDWVTYYGIHDIFFDQCSSGAGDLPYYQDLCDYTRRKYPGAQILLNHGTNCDEGYARMADILCPFEGPVSGSPGLDYATYTPSPWMANWPAGKFLHLIYNIASVASLDATIAQATAQNAGYIYPVDTAIWFAQSALDPPLYAKLRGGGQTFIDAATCAITIATSGAERLNDAGTCTFAISSSATERTNDASTVVIVLSPSALASPFDAGTCTIVIAQSATERHSASGTTSVGISVGELYPGGYPGDDPPGGQPIGIETIVDAGGLVFIVTPFSSTSDSGTQAIVVTQTAAETIRDSGTIVVVVVPTDVETDSASGTVSIGISNRPPVRIGVNNGVTLTPDFETFEALIGRDVQVAMFYNAFPAEPLLYSGQKTTCNLLGMVPNVAWQPTGAGIVAAINAGTHDAYIDAQAANAISYGKPIQIRLMHEGNGNWMDYGPSSTSDANYIAAFQRIVNRFNSAGVTNVEWAWTPNLWAHSSGTIPDPSPRYPGDAYVTWVGLDGYMTLLTPSWTTFEDLFEAEYAVIRALAPSKRFQIGETGQGEPDARGDRVTWFQDLAVTVRDVFTAVEQVNLFNRNKHDGEGDYTLDSGGTNPSDAAAVATVLKGAPFGEYVFGPGVYPLTFAVTQTGAETIRDAGTCSFAVTPTAAERLIDAASQTIVFVPEDSETIVDAGTHVIVISPVDAETIVDAGTHLFQVIGGAFIGDVATITITIVPTALVTISDGGSFLSVINTGELYPGGSIYPDPLLYPYAPLSSEAVVDAGSQSFSITPTGASERIVDAGTVAIVIVPTSPVGVESEAGTCVIVGSHTAAEQLRDAGVCAFSITENDVETPSDAGTVTISITQSYVAGAGVADVVTIGISQSASELVIDAGTVTIIVSPSGTLGLPTDSGTVTFGISSELYPGGLPGDDPLGGSAPAVEQLIASGTVIFTVSESETDSLIQADSGTVSFTVAPAGTEKFGDSGTCIIVVSETASSISSELATVTLVISPTAGETLLASATETVIVTPTASETIRDAAANNVTITQTAGEAPTDSATVTIGISQTYLTGGSGIQFFTISCTATERILDSGTNIFAISQLADWTAGNAETAGRALVVDAGRRMRARNDLVRLRAQQAESLWRRDRIMR